MTKETTQLYLVLKKQYFNEILDGTKTEEYRDFTDFFINKLCILDDEGEIIDCKEFDTVKFQMGYNKDAPQMIVECKEIYIAQDEDIPEKDLQPENFFFVIELGEILEKKNC